MKIAKIYLELIKRDGKEDAYFVARIENCLEPLPGTILSKEKAREYVMMEGVRVIIDEAGRPRRKGGSSTLENILIEGRKHG